MESSMKRIHAHHFKRFKTPWWTQSPLEENCWDLCPFELPCQQVARSNNVGTRLYLMHINFSYPCMRSVDIFIMLFWGGYVPFLWPFLACAARFGGGATNTLRACFDTLSILCLGGLKVSTGGCITRSASYASFSNPPVNTQIRVSKHYRRRGELVHIWEAWPACSFFDALAKVDGRGSQAQCMACTACTAYTCCHTLPVLPWAPLSELLVVRILWHPQVHFIPQASSTMQSHFTLVVAPQPAASNMWSLNLWLTNFAYKFTKLIPWLFSFQLCIDAGETCAPQPAADVFGMQIPAQHSTNIKASKKVEIEIQEIHCNKQLATTCQTAFMSTQ